MFKRNSGFTLIELIVVIAVLGILAAIIIPNISNFTGKAKDARLDADVRNLQTAVDMYRVDSQTGVAEPVVDVFVSVASDENPTGKVVGNIIKTDELVPSQLRKAPVYLKNMDLIDVFDKVGSSSNTFDASVDLKVLVDDLNTAIDSDSNMSTEDKKELKEKAKLDYDKGDVIAVIEYQLKNQEAPYDPEKNPAISTSIVRYLSVEGNNGIVVR